MQTTLKTSVRFDGIGLHSGRPVTLVVRPAATGHGIVFRRTDIDVGNRFLPARWDAVVPSKLCTLLRNDAGAEVSTVEHIMAALAGCGVTNALVDINGPEVPILDGSAAPFVNGILSVGLVDQIGPSRVVEVLKEVEVREGDVLAKLSPADGMYIDFEIDFSDAAIGRQSKSLNMANGNFVRELSHCRTFCRQSDVDAMRDNGLALGGTLENAVVIDGADVVSPGGFRTPDEAVRHKMLDALGDLALAGAPILGRYTGVRSGHAMTNKLLRKLFATNGAWQIVACDAATARRLPGVGVRAQDIPVYA